jgi:hypothetical protein
MNRYFDVTIEHLDGTVETISAANEQEVRDGVLTLWQHAEFSPHAEHLGSWPLATIKKWTRK